MGILITQPKSKTRVLLPKLALLFSMICGVYLTYVPYIANNQGVRGVDTLWYYQLLDQTKNMGDLKNVLLHEPRAFYILLLYIVRVTTSQSSLTVVQVTPALLSIFLALSTYYLVKTGTKNAGLASLASIFATFSIHTTIGMFAGIFANWLAISLIMVSLTLLLKALEKRSKLYLLFAGLSSLLIFLIHRWTWGITMSIFVSYLILSLARLMGKCPNAKQEAVSGLFLLLFNLSPGLAAIISPSLMAGISTPMPSFAVEEIWFRLTAYVSLFNISQLWQNIFSTLTQFVGGYYDNSLTLILSIIGLVAICNYKDNFNRILTSWAFMVSVVLTFYGRLDEMWRFLYDLPFPITAAIGIYFIIQNVKQRIGTPSGAETSDKICFSTFQILLIAVTILALFNYTIRCLSFIY